MAFSSLRVSPVAAAVITANEWSYTVDMMDRGLFQFDLQDIYNQPIESSCLSLDFSPGERIIAAHSQDFSRGTVRLRRKTIWEGPYHVQPFGGADGQIQSILGGPLCTFSEWMDRMLPQKMKAAGVTEELKARDQMAWIGLVNNCKAQV